MAALFSELNDEQLVALLQRGGVGVLPTDTLYGLVCVAGQEAAVEHLYRAKNRNNKPGTVIAANVDQLVKLGLKKRYLIAVQQYWPGSVSVVIPSGDPKTNYLRQGADGLAVRIVKDRNLVNLLLQTGPLLTTSANMPGLPPSKTIDEAMIVFGDSVDFYVDGGNLGKRKPSTLIRVVDDTIEVLRQGAVTIKS